MFPFSHIRFRYRDIRDFSPSASIIHHLIDLRTLLFNNFETELISCIDLYSSPSRLRTSPRKLRGMNPPRRNRLKEINYCHERASKGGLDVSGGSCARWGPPVSLYLKLRATAFPLTSYLHSAHELVTGISNNH